MTQPRSAFADRDGTERLVLLALVAVVLMRLLTLGLYPLTDTTEARYAEVARKMVELGDWITPWYDYGVPFWAKPPLSTWLTAASFKVFGLNEFAARLPHFVLAVATGWLVWDWLRQRDRRQALLGVAMLYGAILFLVSSGAVMTDMALALGTTLAMRGLWLGVFGAPGRRGLECWLAFVGLAIGLLAKGPVALVLICAQVQHDGIVAVLGGLRQSCRTGAGGVDHIAQGFQEAVQVGQDVGVVFNDEDAHGLSRQRSRKHDKSPRCACPVTCMV